MLWQRLYERRETSDSAVIDSRYKTERQRDSFGGSTSGLTHFSAAPAAFLMDAMAAVPRKWVSDGAPTLPGMHERAAARLLWRRLYERWGTSDSAVIDSRCEPARKREGGTPVLPSKSPEASGILL